MILRGAKQLDQVTYANELSAYSRGTQLICIIGFSGSKLVMLTKFDWNKLLDLCSGVGFQVRNRLIV